MSYRDYYIVEHPTRGTLRPDSEPGEPHFSWSGLRTDAEKAWQFTTINDAVAALNRCVTNARVRGECQVRRSPDRDQPPARWGETWEAVWP